MTNLSGFYDLTKSFCDSHPMINQFLFIGSEEELDAIEFDYRTFIIVPESSNISRDGNRPIYNISFDCLIIDKYVYRNEQSLMKCVEENMFIAGQFQDHLIQSNENVDFQDIEIGSLGNYDYNVSTAMFGIDIDFPRSPYTKGIIS